MSKWVYEKDASVWSGLESAWIDNITVTGVMPQGETRASIFGLNTNRRAWTKNRLSSF
jgi:hypothetical protein